MHRPPSVERELAAHAQALRALAHDLVGASDAEDLVQETALRALRSPPAAPHGLGAWLATILRRLAGNHRRGNRRRQRREGAAGGEPILVPPADEAAMRRDSLRAVTQSLWNLPEPYQTTLVLRYFENLSPRAIGEQTDTPVATVKSRLQRGLAMLRQALDGRDREGRWRAVLLAATGTVPVAATITLTAGALLMTPAVKLLSGAAVCAAAAILLWSVDWSTAAPPVPVAEEREATEAASAAVAGTALAEGVQPRREPAPVAMATVEPAAVDLAHPFAYELDCRVLDRDGLPVEGAQLLVGPPGCSLNTWPEPTAADGHVLLNWRAKVPAMVVAIGTSRIDFTLQQVDVRAGARRSLTLLGEATQAARYRSIEKKLEAASRGTKVVAVVSQPPCQSGQPAAQDCRRCHADATYRGSFDTRLQVRHGLHPDATLGDLLLPAVKPAPPAGAAERLARAKMQAIVADEMALKTKSVRSLTREKLAGASGRDFATITGTVYGDDGKPVGGATVAWSQEPDRPRSRTRTDKDGKFLFEKVTPGTVEVRAGGGSTGLGRATRPVFAGTAESVDVTLQRGATVRGCAVGADGAALEGWRVEYVAHDESWSDGVTVGKDGTFAFANLPGAGRLLLWSKDAPALPIALEPTVLPDAGEVRFDLRARGDAKASVRLRALLPDGVDQAAAEVRIWQVATGRGAAMPKGKDGAFELGNLCAGFYRLEVGGEAVGWLDLGQHWIDGLGAVDLGSVRLPKPGTLRLGNRAAGIPVELYLRRDDLDVRAEFEIGERTDLTLPAGRWLVLWGGASALRAREFTIAAGAPSELDLGQAGR